MERKRIEGQRPEQSVQEPPVQEQHVQEQNVQEQNVQEPPAQEQLCPDPAELRKPEEKRPARNLYLQYNDLEFSDKLMFEAAINDYCQKAGVPMESIDSVNLYVKPQEGKAYYVINEDGEKIGSIDL